MCFTCCHPALSPDARVALTLREVAGITTEEIARAWLVSPATIAQRVVRAKAKIRGEKIPYEVPGRAELPARIESVLSVIYLIFNEGYFATEGPSLVRDTLCAQAIRLARLITELLDDAEAKALLALMLPHESRRSASVDDAGDLVLLEHQDRSRWDRALISEARASRFESFDAELTWRGRGRGMSESSPSITSATMCDGACSYASNTSYVMPGNGLVRDGGSPATRRR